jgi:RNA polymerase subunit RPABC4/transcription elongation factor Spt4
MAAPLAGKVVHRQSCCWGDDGDPVEGADRGYTGVAEDLACRGCQVFTDVEHSAAGRVDDRWVDFVVVVKPRRWPVSPEGNAVGSVFALVIDATPPPPR